MFELPNYLEHIRFYINPEIWNDFLVIEKSLHDEGYIQHHEELNNLVGNLPNSTTADVLDGMINVYIDTIHYILLQDGIEIKSEENTSFNTLIRIFLAIQKIPSVDMDMSLKDDEDHVEYLSRIVVSIDESIDVGDCYNLFFSVHPDIVSMLGGEEESDEEIPDEEIVSRFKQEVGDQTTGVIINYVKDNNTIGFNPITIAKHLSELLPNPMTHQNDYIKEVRLLVLGSNTSIEDIPLVTYEVNDILIDDIIVKSKINKEMGAYSPISDFR